jgi:hypothetical protein
VGRTIVCIGDSITDCHRLTDPRGLGGGYVDIVATALRERGDDATVVNTGISGDRVEHLDPFYVECTDQWSQWREGDVFARADLDLKRRSSAGSRSGTVPRSCRCRTRSTRPSRSVVRR